MGPMRQDPRIETDESGRSIGLSRRGVLAAMGALGAAGLSGPTVDAQPGNDAGRSVSGEVSVLKNPAFVTNARGDGLPKGDELVFDTGPVSIPLDRFVERDGEYNSKLFRSLNDSRQLVVKQPEGYDREDGYDDPWEPLRWRDVSDTGGTATVGPVTGPDGGDGDAGTAVDIEVTKAIPNGQYTIWVVKYAALKNPEDDRFQDNPFVSPAGNGLVGFHNLGQKFGGPGSSENEFRTDSEGDGSISVVTEGGPLTGVPGYRPLGDDPVEDGPVPFVGTEDDYEQSGRRLSRIQNNLRAEDQISFVGAYHYDDQTWGVYPGPWHLNQFGVSFVFE